MICACQTLQQSKLDLRIPNDQHYFDFQFPSSSFKTRLFRQPNEINTDLQRLGIKHYFRKGRVFIRDESITKFTHKVIFKCRFHKCNARLMYLKNKDQQYMHIIEFNNLHHHKRLRDPEKGRRQQINQFIFHLRGEEYQKYRKVPRWVERFDITNSEGLYITEQVYWYNNTQDDVMAILAHEGNLVRRVTEGEDTVLILVISQTMRHNHQEFGETLTMELYHETVKVRKPIGDNHAVGYLIGQDSNLNILLLGIFVIVKQTPLAYKVLFETYFDIMCPEPSFIPKCILTDQIEAVTIALQQLKREHHYQYAHLFPWYHIIRRWKAKLRSLLNGKQIMEILCQAMQETSQLQYFQLMCQAKTMLVKQAPHLFDQWVQTQTFYCYRRLHRGFSGFAVTTTLGEKILGQVENPCVYKVHTGRLFHKLLNIEKHLIAKSNKVRRINYEIIKYCPLQINTLYDKLETHIMDIILRTYYKSKDCQLLSLSPLQIRITQKTGNVWMCRFELQYDHWECECLQIVHTGLPCCHLMRIVMDKDIQGSLLYYIDSRWMCAKEDKAGVSLRGNFITNMRRRRK